MKNCKIVPITSEKKLEELVISYPEQINDKLKILKSQYRTNDGFGIIDVLMYQEGYIIATEIKAKDDIDGYAIYQALDYWLYIKKNISSIQKEYPKLNIKDAKLMIISPSYSTLLLERAKLLSALVEIELYTYKYLKLEGKEESIIYEKVNYQDKKEKMKDPKTSNSTPEVNITPEELIESIQDNDKKELAKKILNNIRDNYPIIEMTCKNSIIKFMFNKQVKFYLVIGKDTVRLDCYDSNTLKWKYNKVNSDNLSDILLLIKWNIETNVRSLLKEQNNGNSEEKENIFDTDENEIEVIEKVA